MTVTISLCAVDDSGTIVYSPAVLSITNYHHKQDKLSKNVLYLKQTYRIPCRMVLVWCTFASEAISLLLSESALMTTCDSNQNLLFQVAFNFVQVHSYMILASGDSIG